MNPTRPRTVAFVAGTATDIGKTWWTAALARELRAAGMHVAARKPVQSGEPGATTDAEVLAAATGERLIVPCGGLDFGPPDATYMAEM